MSWEVKYRCEYKDIYGVAWKADIEEDDWGGAITELKATEDPLEIDWDNISDDVFDSLKSSEASLEVFSTTNFAIADIYAIQDLQFRMSIYQNDILYWRGFVNSRNYKEPYDEPPYPVTITAVCGLEFLKDYLYASDISIADGVETITYYDGFKLESQILIDIFSKIGITGFTEFINIYEDSQDSDVDDSALDQTAINVDVFKDFYCDEVLKEILKKYNACIVHKDGGFVIYRPADLVDETVYGRVFTAPKTKTATSFSPVQYINRSTHESILIQVSGGVMMITRPAKKVTIFQNYKYRESWLENYELQPSTFTGNYIAGFNAVGWSKVGLCWAPMNYKTAIVENGVLLVHHNTYPALTEYIYQDFGYLAEITADEVFGISFDYQWINEQSSIAADQTFYFSVSIEAGANDYYLVETVDSDVLCEWSNDPGFIGMSLTEDVDIGFSGWSTWSRRFTSIPHAGPIRVAFYCLSDAGTDIFIGIRNVKFFGSSDAVSRKFTTGTRQVDWYWWLLSPQSLSGNRTFNTVYNIENKSEIVEKTYVVDNGINGEISERRYILGDVVDSELTNILEQFNGALARVVYGTLAGAIDDFDTNHSAAYTGIDVTNTDTSLIFTEADGNDFTGASSITGDLSGSVVNAVPHTAAKAQIDIVYISSGTYGRIDITCNGVTCACNWDTNKETTMTTFTSSGPNIAAFAAVDVVLDRENPNGSNGGIRFTGLAGASITTSVSLFNGDMGWSKYTEQNAAAAIARVDIVNITGVTGKADITVDNVTREIEIAESIYPTESWSSRGGSEAKQLLEIIGDEIAVQYARPKQLIQMPIIETGDGASSVNVVGYFQDDLNKYSETERKFVFNRGSFKTKYRKWNIDLNEIL